MDKPRILYVGFGKCDHRRYFDDLDEALAKARPRDIVEVANSPTDFDSDGAAILPDDGEEAPPAR